MRSLGARDVLGDEVQRLRHRQLERLADGGEQLGRGFLLAALDLAQVTERDARRLRYLAQGAPLRLTLGAQHVTELFAKQDHAYLLVTMARACQFWLLSL